MDDIFDDELTYNGMVALITRWNLVSAKRKEQMDTRDAAIKKIAECDKEIAAFKAACLSFGYDRGNEDSWQEARRLFYLEAAKNYNRIRPTHLPEMALTIPSPDDVGKKATEKKEDRPLIRDLTMARVTEAGERGIKAAEIRDFIEASYPASPKLHEKTVGMTLYRLLQDGLVRREGHTWFLVAPKGETKNPAGETAGHETSR